VTPGPPLHLTRSQASRAASRELSRGIYAHTSWTRDLGRTALAALRRLLHAAPGHSGPVGVLVLLAALVVVAAVVLGAVRIGAPRRNARRDRQPNGPNDAPTALTAADLRGRAAAAAETGDWTIAVLAGFRAVARDLVDAAAVPTAAGVPALTAAELVESVAPTLPAAADELRAAAAVFGAVSYGYRRAGPGDAATVTAADLAVRAALTAGPRPAVRS
jgi:hypothetical protein